jgi:hypothetical protein
MPRPRSENPGCKVTLYLRGEHLDVLRRFNGPYADAIRALIEREAASRPAEPEAREHPPMCVWCASKETPVPGCPRCADAREAEAAGPRADQHDPRPGFQHSAAPICARDQ